jgi:hypothetical protein
MRLGGVQLFLWPYLDQQLWPLFLRSKPFREPMLLSLGHSLCLRGAGRAWLGYMDALRRGRWEVASGTCWVVGGKDFEEF